MLSFDGILPIIAKLPEIQDMVSDEDICEWINGLYGGVYDDVISGKKRDDVESRYEQYDSEPVLEIISITGDHYSIKWRDPGQRSSIDVLSDGVLLVSLIERNSSVLEWVKGVCDSDQFDEVQKFIKYQTIYNYMSSDYWAHVRHFYPY